MTNFALYQEVALQCSRITTEQYSTSFAYAIRLLHKDLQAAIHAIYGLVRFADEIVDTFHTYDKAVLLKRFRTETFTAIEEGISLLTCHALATAWGLRNPGATAPEHICPPGSGLMTSEVSLPKPHTSSPASGHGANIPANY